MKKFIINAVVIGLLIFSSACEKELDLQPEQSLSTELAFSDRLTAQGSLLGVYSLGQDLNVYGSMPQVIADYQSDNVDFTGSFPTLQSINNYATLSNNSSIQDIWRYHYRLILAANAVIKNVPLVEDATFTSEEKGQFVGEAKFLRALTYFQLVNLFAQPLPVANGSNPGVPLVLDAYEGTVTLPARATVNEVHAQIKKDLDEAVTALPEEYETPEFTRGRATKGAAYALLSRLYLYRGEWQSAADNANLVMESNVYTLASNYSFYSGISSEDVFAILNSATDNGRTGSGGWASYYNPAENNARGDAPFSAELVAAYNAEPNDKRFTQLTQVGDNGRIYTTKFPDSRTNSDNARIIRITEIYLNRAEALAQLNSVNEESVDLINNLRERAGLSKWTIGQFTDKSTFISAILNERRKELAFEGHRRMDLLRNSQGLRSTGSRIEAAKPGQPKTILPIPQRERDLNTNLEQNTGY